MAEHAILDRAIPKITLGDQKKSSQSPLPILLDFLEGFFFLTAVNFPFSLLRPLIR